MCTVSNNIETSRINSYICPHSFTPLRQRRKFHSDAVEVTLKKLAALASIRLRCTVMAAIWKTRHNNSMTSRLYGRRAIFVSGDIRFQDGDAVNLSKLGGVRYLLFSTTSFQCFIALAYFTIRYIYRTTVILWYNGPCDIPVLFVHDATQCAWRWL